MTSSTYTSPEYTHCIRETRFRYNVYEPEADTFLFLEALDADKGFLAALQPRRCVEVGCGSGTVITHLRYLLLPSSAASEEKADNVHVDAVPAVGGPQFSVVDVNPLALEATGITWTDTLLKHFAASTLTLHFLACFNAAVPANLAAPVAGRGPTVPSASSADAGADTLSDTCAPSSSPCIPSPLCSSTYCLHRYHGDLLEAVRPTVEADGQFDVLLFNPPYVPTSLEELEDAIAKKDVITAAWCGGPRGRVVLDRFLQQLPSVMSRHGVCYLVLIRENEVRDVVAFAQRCFREHLRSEGVLPTTVSEGVLEAVEVAARYTGEHLMVYRLRYLPPYQQ